MAINRKRILFIGLVILNLIVLIGTAMLVKDNKKKRQYKFGATYMTMNNPYFVALDENLKEVVEAHGDILITRDPLQDQEKQNEQIMDMLNEKIDALFLQPVDRKEVQSALDKCYQEGIPVFVLDSDVYSSDKVVSTIISDNYHAGVQCAVDMMEKRESANIVILKQKKISSMNERVRGFMDTIERHPEYQIVAIKDSTAEVEGAMEEMKDVLFADIDFDVVLGGNDPTALGCIAAMQMVGSDKEVMVYGIDGSPEAKMMIRAGYMEATSAQSPVQIGTQAAETAYQYLSGQSVKKRITIPVTLITEDNLYSYDIAGWQ